MNGVDCIVFTAGVGENERTIREKILENFCYLGLLFDREANEKHGPVITAADSKVAAVVVHTDEEKVIAADTFEILKDL
jgi:acetate kinase